MKTHLPNLGVERLVELLWGSMQRDNVLERAMMASVAIELAKGNFETAKAAIDYAFYFPDYIRYADCNHGCIIDEIKITLKCLRGQVSKNFVTRVAQYVLELGQSVTSNFEDDWSWSSALEDFEHWFKQITDDYT